MQDPMTQLVKKLALDGLDNGVVPWYDEDYEWDGNSAGRVAVF